jgi:hypothetical protein
VIAFVCLRLAALTLSLPDLIFGAADDPEVAAVWAGRFLQIHKVYEGLAWALGIILPASLFSTLGTLSYCSLRVAVAQQIATPPEETSFQGAAGTRVGGPDSTHPAGESRPEATSSALPPKAS